jgi:hypothetical protein
MGGSLTEDEITQLRKANRYKNIKFFVEGGTYLADSTMLASKHFDHVYTIEIAEKLYNDAKQRGEREGATNVTFLLGDTVKLIGGIAEQVKEGAVYFLDAHISGGITGWNGTQRVPIFEELEEILKHQHGPSIFIIDDCRLWVDQVWDWSHITTEKLVQVFLDKGYQVLSYYIKDDRLYIYI